MEVSTGWVHKQGVLGNAASASGCVAIVPSTVAPYVVVDQGRHNTEEVTVEDTNPGVADHDGITDDGYLGSVVVSDVDASPVR